MKIKNITIYTFENMRETENLTIKFNENLIYMKKKLKIETFRKMWKFEELQQSKIWTLSKKSKIFLHIEIHFYFDNWNEFKITILIINQKIEKL